MILDDLDLWTGQVKVSDKVYPDEEPGVFISPEYKSILEEGDSIPVTNPATGDTFQLPVLFSEDANQQRARFSAGAAARMGLTPGEGSVLMDFDPQHKIPGTTVRSMSYGPDQGDPVTPATTIGTFDNKLQPYDVAVSPNLEGKFPMKSFIEDAEGNILRVADRSYFHSEDEPTSNTIERRDRPDTGSETYRPISVEEVQKRLGETPTRAMLAGQPTAASLQYTMTPEKLAEMRKKATVDEDGMVHYNDGMNTRVNPKTGVIMRDVGDHTSITTQQGAGKFQTHWVKKPKPSEQPLPSLAPGISPEAAMNSLSPADQASAKEILSGKGATYTRFGRETPNYSRLKEYIYKIDPGFDPSKAARRQQAMTQYYSQKQTDPGGQISSFNQGMHHLGSLITAMEKLPTGSIRGFNNAREFLADQFGVNSKEFSDYETAVNVMSMEMARAFRKSAPDKADIDEQKSKFGAVRSRAGLESILKKEMPELLGGALLTLDNGYTKATGEHLPGDVILDKESREGLLKLGIDKFIGRDMHTGKRLEDLEYEGKTGATKQSPATEARAYAKAVKVLQSGVAAPELQAQAQQVLESLRLRGLLDENLKLIAPLSP